MDLSEAVGYLAAGLVFTTFCMKTMMPLRYVAITSNFAFITYGVVGGLYPILILHTILLPLNLYRLHEIRKTIRGVREAVDGDLNVQWLLPYMRKRRFAAGEVLFEKNDPAHEMFYVVSGTVRLDELGHDLGAGDLIGEIGLFAPDQMRMDSATCTTDGELLAISDQKVMELLYQNREFAFFLIRLVTGRLIHDLRDHAKVA
ncbi:MAG: cyclic nucleotide-binding domain-containing protein [Alphaproteobacteria bacterium]|nr:cyclic nucleotide-binding domain-containing protein [Alphaproteobacteria bacterium]